MKKSGISRLLLLMLLFCSLKAFSQADYVLKQQTWVDSVFTSLTEDQRIAQLMVVRLSERSGGRVLFYDKEVEEQIKKYNIGSICLFQGGPVQHAQIINRLQGIAQTPLMICIDGETGVGMRFTDSVAKFPDQLTMGALTDGELVYQLGKAMGEQCRRIGIHVNYAPVIDINNNPDNPVINFRSFGEDKYKVSLFGTRIMQGMQEMGIMACAKHFPGHGDVAVDSHRDLPVITKSRIALDSLELYPFRQLFSSGVASTMVAHLYIPAIDNSTNRATSLSYNNVTKLLRTELDFQGLTFTDALEMQGVKKFFPDGEASVESIIAGNDMLCLPGDLTVAINKIKEAINQKRLSWEDINTKVKRVLHAKYQYVVPYLNVIEAEGITSDLNQRVPELRKAVAENAITLVKNDYPLLFPLNNVEDKKLAYLGIGLREENAFARRMKEDYKADLFYFDYQKTSIGNDSIINRLKEYDVVITGVHNYAKYPANNFGMSWAAAQLMQRLQLETPNMILFFGNPYAIKNVCDGTNIMVCYEDDEIFHQAAADILKGRIAPKGRLPVTVCEAFPYGTGIMEAREMTSVHPRAVGLNEKVLGRIDSIASDAISRGATPGCVVLVAKDGKIAYEKAFGHYSVDKTEKLQTESIYDLASVTKVYATTLAVMKLYEQGKIDLKKRLGDYLDWVRGTNKEQLLIEDILLHRAGLSAYIPFHRETINPKSGLAYYTIYSKRPSGNFSVRIAEGMYMRKDWTDTLYKRILQSPLGARGNYVYSDNDFIFLGKIVEALTGTTLDKFVKKEFYDSLKMSVTGFKPRERFPLNQIVPTEREYGFRAQLLRGDVHDPGAAMFGEVAGHAGLFSNVYDLALLSQMLLNGGEWKGKRYLSKETIELFTSYHDNNSRRGYGFDKPDKENYKKDEPYPCPSASPETYGHTGFTGTCVWVDPQYGLVYIFLSNRVNSFNGSKLGQMNVRGKIQETIYQAMKTPN